MFITSSQQTPYAGMTNCKKTNVLFRFGISICSEGMCILFKYTQN